jgi:beta-galactosidase
LSANGIKSQLYDAVKKVDRFINNENEDLLLSKTTSQICVGLYKPYFYTELTTSQMLKEKRLEVSKLGLLLDPRFVREEVFFNGLLRGLQTLNFNYDIKDLENVSVEALLKYKQLWVTTTEFMDPVTQSLLATFVKQGGHLIIYPVTPTLDLYLNPCNVMKDELNIEFNRSLSSNKVEAFGIKDIFTVFKEKQIFKSTKADIVAKNDSGETCGIRKKIGKGFIIILGFAFSYTTDEHLSLYEKILSLDKIKRQAKVSDPDIQYVIRKSKKYSYMFLMNYHNQKKTFKVNLKRYTLTPFSSKIIKSK